MLLASDRKFLGIDRTEWGGGEDKRILFFLAIRSLPFSPNGFQKGLKAAIASKVGKKRILGHKRIICEAKFMGSHEPSNCRLGLFGCAINGCNVETISAIGPIDFLVGFDPDIDMKRHALADTQQSNGILHRWIGRRAF